LEEASNLMQSIKDKIKTTKGVKEIKGVFGLYDFVVLANTETLQELGNLVTSLVRNIKGVSETETLVVGF
jgi:DNA-binding Lrp family transcriptional regulator